MTFASDLFINSLEVMTAVILTTTGLTTIMIPTVLNILNTRSVLSMTRQFN